MSHDEAEIDLRGVPCPLNWARARVRLDELSPGQRLTLLIDDPRSLRDLPGAAEAAGFAVVDVAATGAWWRMTIEA